MKICTQTKKLTFFIRHVCCCRRVILRAAIGWLRAFLLRHTDTVSDVVTEELSLRTCCGHITAAVTIFLSCFTKQSELTQIYMFICQNFYRSKFQQTQCLLRHREGHSHPASELLRKPLASNHPWHSRNLPQHIPGQICGHSLRWGHRTILPLGKTWEYLSHCHSHNIGFLRKSVPWFIIVLFPWWFFTTAKPGKSSVNPITNSSARESWLNKRVTIQHFKHDHET